MRARCIVRSASGAADHRAPQAATHLEIAHRPHQPTRSKGAVPPGVLLPAHDITVIAAEADAPLKILSISVWTVPSPGGQVSEMTGREDGCG